ncbi:hypothetical protein ABV23_RS00190 [Escherichia coli]|nr:hypothetical protein [Escherichia coli]
MKKEIRIQFGMRKKEVICTLNHAVVEMGGALQKFSHFVLVLYENGSFKIFTYDDSKNYRNDFVNLTVLLEEEFFQESTVWDLPGAPIEYVRATQAEMIKAMQNYPEDHMTKFPESIHVEVEY